MSNPQPLPSLQRIEQMERQRKKAFDALEISDGHVKCQRCGTAVRIAGKLEKRPDNNDRIGTLKVRLSWLYKHNGKQEDIKAVKQELDELLKEDSEYEKLRSIPLKYYRKKFVCLNCVI